MSRHEVKLHPYSFAKEFRVNQRSDIKASNYGNSEKRYMFYVKNRFSNDSFESGFTLYAYEIVKETSFYYFLINKQRIRKDNEHKRFATTPEDAVRRAVKRAETYLRILMDKAQTVNQFLIRADGSSTRKRLKDSYGFESFVKSIGPEDEIPPEVYLKEMRRELDIPY